jgi:hypothetical protein
MALTRTEVEETLYRRVAPAMARADMSVLADGSNPFMGDSITFSLLELGYSAPVKFTDPADTDLTQVPETDYQRFLGVCEWRLVKNVLGNLDDTDEKLGPTGMWNSQFAKQMERYLDNLEMRLLTEYGWGPTTLSAGTLRVITVQQDTTS